MSRRRSRIVLSTLIFVLAARAGATDFVAWILNRGVAGTIGDASDDALPVGSLQKPFVVRAWAASHATEASPRFFCSRASSCWRPAGHGALDLRSALRESCNTYFREMAADTPRDALAASFREAGFAWEGDITPAEAIGLPGPSRLRIAPRQILAAYRVLVRTPWSAREDIRGELLSGLRDAADEGTAAGLRLFGLRAKTGTVPALDGTPLATSGFALVLDDAEFAFLGLLRRGTGREAAIRAGAEIARLRPGLIPRVETPAPPKERSRASLLATTSRSFDRPVRVEMLGELRPGRLSLRNESGTPVDSTRGFIGPDATVDARANERYADGVWRIRSVTPAFERVVRGELDVVAAGDSLRIVATMAAREYVDGVLRAELSPSVSSLRTALGATILRFARRGPRHAGADFCDSTHCAWFVGRGPVPRWVRPDRAVVETSMIPALSDAEWTASLASARKDVAGPSSWTADCGGEPVSPHFIWGNGDRRIETCPRHPRGRGKTWRRTWSTEDLRAVFGGSPTAIDVVEIDGRWTLKVALKSDDGSPARTLGLDYDDAHRRLASKLGWDAMPAPASRVSIARSGFVAEGVGFGHRVGLCLAP